nr:reverse transcriptase domain-containing protein [Tanacetum cinerariifolium]
MTDDALRLYLFPHSLTHHATAWFDRLPRNSINTFELMAKMFLAQRSESSSSITSSSDAEIAAMKAEMAESNKNIMKVLQVNQQVKAVPPSCETCGGPHSFSDCPTIVGNTQNVYAARAYQGNSYQPQGNGNLLSYRSNNYLGPPGFNQNQNRNNQNQNFHNQNRNQGNHNPQGNNQGRNQFFQGANQNQNPPPSYQAQVYQAPVHQPLIPLPQVVTTNEFTNFMKANDAILKNMQNNMTSLTNSNLELKNMFGDPGKFLIPCDFPRMAECLALADLGASINLMPLSVWNKLSLPDLSPTCMTLELTNCLISRLVGVAKDVFVKVGTFHFLADFVVVDFNADPRVPLILGRSFLKTGKALIDVFEGELTLRVGKEAITFNLDQTSRYSANYNDMTANQIDYDLIVSTTSPTLTPFGNSDFLLEEVDAFLALKDNPTSPEVDQCYVDTEGDILLLDAFLNDDPLLPPPNQGNYLPHVRKEIKICEAKIDKSLIDEPLEVELKDLPPHLEYAFLEGDDKFPVIIAKDLSVEEKTALITEKSHFMVKVDVINKLPHPTTGKGIHSILSHADIYGRFIKDFSKIARPMTRLLEKDTTFFFSKKCVEAFQTLKRKLTEAPILIALYWDLHFEFMCDASDFAIECVEAFQTLKRKLTESPILIAPDLDMSFELICDASDFAIGAFLGQRQDKHSRLIHYASKNMTEAESNYTTTKKEMLAVVTPWFADFANYHAGNFDIKGTSSHKKSKFFKDNPTEQSRLGKFLSKEIFEGIMVRIDNAFVHDETKSSSTSLNSLLEETNNFHNSLPEFTTFSKVLFDAECESDSSDDQSCSDEDVLEKIVSKPLSEEEIIPMEFLRTHDSSLLISSKFDSLLDEFAGELPLLKSILPGIDETDCDFEEDIRLIEKLLYDNSSPRPPEEFVSANSDASTKSFSPSPILVKDSDSLMEEIDLFCTPDYPMPPGIVDKDYDSERDILIRKDLPSNNTLSFAEKESLHFDIPLFSRPLAKPPDGDTGILNIKMMGDISDQKDFMHKLMVTLASHQETSPDLLSHRCGTVKKFNTYRSHLNKCPMLFHGQNNPPLDILLFHFYPP